MRKDLTYSVSYVRNPEQPVQQPPKDYCLAAVAAVRKKVDGVEVDFDENGDIRRLTASDPQGFLKGVRFSGNPRAHARKLLNLKEIRKGLDLQHVELRDGDLTYLPLLGWRVEFRRVLRVRDRKRPVRVRHGFVHVCMTKSGSVYSLTSTLRNSTEETPSAIGRVISRKKAIKAAQAKHGMRTCEPVRCELTFSPHEGRMDPVYEVVLTSCQPRRVVEYLVKARTGEVVYSENKLHLYTSGAVPGRVFLRIPNPNTPIDRQIHDAVIESLPDPKVLKTEHFTFYLGNTRQEVRAKADGTFNYTSKDPQFGAVVTCFAQNTMLQKLLEWGLRKPDQPIPEFVRDTSVQDNAYFDPEALEIHLGVGSGLPRGLNKYIEFDLGVGWHEFWHYVVYLMAPGKDLPGSEGGAIHEACGDYGDLLGDFWFRLFFGKQMGHELTKQEVEADRRIIGIYALPPNGIRQQKNSKRTPRDKTGEPHDDGEIIGGAMSDVMVGLATASDPSLEQGLAAAGKLCIAALALVPAHKVTFKDMLRAFVTADQALNSGKNRVLIEKCFADHGITLSQRIEQPVIIKVPRRRSPRKGR